METSSTKRNREVYVDCQKFYSAMDNVISMVLKIREDQGRAFGQACSLCVDSSKGYESLVKTMARDPNDASRLLPRYGSNQRQR